MWEQLGDTLSIDRRGRRINIFNTPPGRPTNMVLEMEHDCPHCGGSQTFWRTAATTLHLGDKTKWRCSECDYGFIQIDGIDSSQPV